eukprot:10343710-Alexandrium_andersonii.AAC.1
MPRLIVDGRPGNARLAPPPRTALASAQAFSELVLEKGQRLFVGSLDVENAFYNYEVPDWFGELYASPALSP